MKIETAYLGIVKNLREYFKAAGATKAVIGLSGGVDSSLTLKIAVDALGGDNVTGILMPEIGLTSKENITHALGLAEYFGVKTYTASINQALVPLNILPWKQNERARMQVKARIRMTMLYNFANANEGTLVLGTSNKTECLLGYGTKFGDCASDVLVIGSLLKTQVWEMARFLGLPDEIVNKVPSAELAAGQTDEAELGGSYLEFDKILVGAMKECSDFSDEKKREKAIEVLVEKGMNPLLVRKAFYLISMNLHKGLTPPVM